MKEKLFAIVLLAAFLLGCKEDNHEPLLKSKSKPGVVTNLEVENLPGGAKITYALPDDPELLYVVAKFASKSGEERVVKSSLYKNFVLLEGFSDTKDYQVTLHTVNRAEVQSDAVNATISPLTPPIHTVFNSLQLQEDFGGIRYTFENELQHEYVFHTLIKDAEGKWVRLDRLYTKAKTRTYAVRGLPAVEKEFGIFITDKWKNTSDTLKKTLVPLFEERLDKKLWKNAKLASDFYTPVYSDRTLEKIWNDKHGTYDYFIAAAAPIAPPLPNWFTIDLGKQAKLSRMKIHQYEGVGKYVFALGNPRKFEIWGSNVASDDWSNWDLLLECETFKPSGLPLGSRTDEDLAYALAGEDYTFPLNLPRYRYIRFKLLETWARVPNLLLDEITFWGQ